MKYYLRVVGEGFGLAIIPILAIAVAALYVVVSPFFLLGLIKRGAISVITGGDPLVP